VFSGVKDRENLLIIASAISLFVLVKSFAVLVLFYGREMRNGPRNFRDFRLGYKPFVQPHGQFLRHSYRLLPYSDLTGMGAYQVAAID
jgi:hypothetical protein